MGKIENGKIEKKKQKTFANNEHHFPCVLQLFLTEFCREAWKTLEKNAWIYVSLYEIPKMEKWKEKKRRKLAAVVLLFI